MSRWTENAQTTAVTREATGQLTALRRGAGSTDPARFYPLTDALGSVIALIDAAGTQTDTFGYDPYGRSTGRTGSTDNPFRFTGEYNDATGLYKIGLRYYQPENGRWTQQDPARRATNPTTPPDVSPYQYVGNNPVNYTEPTGACQPETCRSPIADAGTVLTACVQSSAIRGAFGALSSFASVFKVTPAGLAVSCLTGLTGAGLRSLQSGDLVQIG